jgi:hypothetical protein
LKSPTREAGFACVAAISIAQLQSPNFNRPISIAQFQSPNFNRPISIAQFQSPNFNHPTSIAQLQSPNFNRPNTGENYRIPQPTPYPNQRQLQIYQEGI